MAWMQAHMYATISYCLAIATALRSFKQVPILITKHSLVCSFVLFAKSLLQSS